MSDAIDTTPMTKGERDDLAKVVRMNAKVARTRVDQLKAERLADLEAQLSARYKVDDERWTTITAEAQQLVNTLDAEVAAICEREGIPAEFRPGIALGWYGRGENLMAKRRAELRKRGQAKVEAVARQARAEIEAWQAAACTDLVSRGLSTGEARGWLEALPVADALVPVLEVAELEAGLGGGQC